LSRAEPQITGVTDLSWILAVDIKFKSLASSFVVEMDDGRLGSLPDAFSITHGNDKIEWGHDK
jgi:hypothetical protein